MNAESSVERKLILPPAAVVDLLYKMHGGKFIDGDDFDLTNVLQEMEFPAGQQAKQAKLEASRQGNIIVNRSVVTITNGIFDECRILFMHRDQHVITTGGSILTSGDPRLAPSDILAKKVEISIPPDEKEFQKLGTVLSVPEQTGGIHYLFEVFRARIAQDASIKGLKDNATLIPLAQADAALMEKPLERAVLQRIIASAA